MDLVEQVGQRFRGHPVTPLPGLPAARRDVDLSDGAAPRGVPLTAAIDDGDSPRDVIDLLALDAFSTGRQPYARSRDLENVRPAARLLPPSGRVVRDAESEYVHARLAVGPGWTARAVRHKHTGGASVLVTAVCAELAAEQLELAVAGAVQPAPPSDDRVPIGFWHLSARGPQRRVRDIDAGTWQQVWGNYARRVADAVDPLVALTGTSVRGRLLLLHGPPGTGKTSLLRTLARQWRPWCRVECVLDPEQLLGSPSYLLDVALGNEDEDEDGGEGHGPRWRMLLLEDCDELIRSEAKAGAGQALSRLLNLTDGLVGQGRNVLVAITTNENLVGLHPAVVRPGRCLARLEVGRLPADEAAAWLAASGSDRPVTDPTGATLAELYALRDGPIATGEPEPPAAGTGLYL